MKGGDAGNRSMSDKGKNVVGSELPFEKKITADAVRGTSTPLASLPSVAGPELSGHCGSHPGFPMKC